MRHQKIREDAANLLEKNNFYQGGLTKDNGKLNICLVLAVNEVIKDNEVNCRLTVQHDIFYDIANEVGFPSSMSTSLIIERAYHWNDTHTKEEVIAALRGIYSRR